MASLVNGATSSPFEASEIWLSGWIPLRMKKLGSFFLPASFSRQIQYTLRCQADNTRRACTLMLLFYIDY